MKRDPYARSAFVLGGLVLAFGVAAAPPATTQSHASSPTDSYYVNEGLDSSKNWGEFAVDLGSFIPFVNYTDSSHYWQSQLSTEDLRDLMLDHATDLDALEAALDADGADTSSFFPSVTVTAVTPHDAWWGSNPEIKTWTCEINGGPVVIARRSSATGDAHMLLINFARHNDDFKQRPIKHMPFEDPPPQFWTSSGGEVALSPEEQAVDAGAVVVFTAENLSADFWTALQRTQDAEHFVRNVWFPSEYTGQTIENSYLHGGSWGSQMTGMFAMLQPKIYAGGVGHLALDIGYNMSGGDWPMLFNHYRAGIGASVPDRPHSNDVRRGFHLWVDALDVRFDNSTSGWDVGALSQNHRPDMDVLKVPNQAALIGDEDPTVNPHWEDGEDAQLERRYIKNLEHGGIVPGIVNGVNEYWAFDGNEWSELLADTTGGPAASNLPLIPGGTPSYDVYPDPYSHTLRTEPCTSTAPTSSTLLTKLDSNPDAPVVPGSPCATTPNQLLWIGQGVIPGDHDNIRASDIDGDGDVEVYFGNFEGYFHVLEMDEDAEILVDEWRSPPLGWGLSAMFVDEDATPPTIYVADAMGRVHRVYADGSDCYSTDSSPFLDASSTSLYEAPVPILVTGNFHPRPGLEIFALNDELDWILFTKNAYEYDRLWRSTLGSGPGTPAVANVDGDSYDELIVPALDGHLWCVQWDTTALELDIAELAPPSDPPRALYGVLVADLDDTASPPSHLIAFGRNLSETNSQRLILYAYDSGSWSVVDDIGFGSLFDFQKPSYAWLDDPTDGSGTLVVGAGGTVKLIDVDGSSETLSEDDSTSIPGASRNVLPITSVDVVEVDEDTTRIVVGVANGRIFLLDENLDFVRTAPGSFTGTALPWYSNRTLGHTSTLDVYGDLSSLGLYFAEFTQPAYDAGTNDDRYRVGSLVASGGTLTWTDWLFDAENDRAVSTPHFDRHFVYDDVDPDLPSGTGSDPEAYFHGEAGAVYHDSTAGEVRQFSNIGLDAGIFLEDLGGHVFERYGTLDYSLLDEFYVPKDSTKYDNGNTDDWWYPQVGDDRLTGQVANPLQGRQPFYLGSSMTIAMLPDPEDESEEPDLLEYVVTGTLGGYVYAIAPGAKSTAMTTPTETASELHYASEDLGWSAVGLAAGNLDEDPEDELVVGTWLDKGNHDDWESGETDVNRGHVLILEIDTANGEFDVVEDLDPASDDLMDMHGCGPFGVSTGVLGVAIDDVDGDGENEIWAGDANYLYLFRRDETSGDWECVYRSEYLGAYPGAFNNIFPVKNGEGETALLVVASSGYIHSFLVDPDEL